MNVYNKEFKNPFQISVFWKINSYPFNVKPTGKIPTSPATILSAEENDAAKTLSNGNNVTNAMIATRTITNTSKAFSFLPKLLRVITNCPPFYHNELLETFLDTKFAMHKITILTSELNKPIAVAYEN